ncbi:MAG: hypothetical protein ABIP48_27475 [Planctomycetota bacterium]
MEFLVSFLSIYSRGTAMISMPSDVAFLQATIFTPNSQVAGQHLLRLLPDAWLQLFTGEPVLLPRHPQAPPEVPFLLLRDSTEDWSLQVSAARVDIKRTIKTRNASSPTKDFFSRAARLFTEFKSITDVKVGRLAAVVHRFALCEDSGIELARQFCKPECIENGPFNRPQTIELHAHKRYKTRLGIDVNSWVRNKTASLAESGEPIVVVEQDINTFPEALLTADMDDTAICRFFESVVDEFDITLARYYPNA